MLADSKHKQPSLTTQKGNVASWELALFIGLPVAFWLWPQLAEMGLPLPAWILLFLSVFLFAKGKSWTDLGLVLKRSSWAFLAVGLVIGGVVTFILDTGVGKRESPLFVAQGSAESFAYALLWVAAQSFAIEMLLRGYLLTEMQGRFSEYGHGLIIAMASGVGLLLVPPVSVVGGLAQFLEGVGLGLLYFSAKGNILIGVGVQWGIAGVVLLRQYLGSV